MPDKYEVKPPNQIKPEFVHLNAMYRVIPAFVGPAFILGYTWICSTFLPFPIGSVEKVLYEPIGYIPAVLFGGFFGLIPIFYHRLIEFAFLKESKPNNKLLAALFIIGLVAGLVINQANYFLVIQPNHMIECPKELGYKNNLMSFFVNDLSLCKEL